MVSPHVLPLLVACATGGALLGGCAAGDTAAGTQVVAAFYPLEFVAERVGGEQVEVTSLTGSGVEPHDVELNPRDVAAVSDADVVVYLSGFQPAVDQAVEQTGPRYVVDAADYSGPALTVAGDADPHFWLDPTRLTTVAGAVADQLAAADPDSAETYATNAKALATDLARLDAELADGLASCRQRSLVTAHTAFGYLADRYGLEQVGVAGVSPEDEPSATDLAEISRFVAANDVTTIFTEPLTSPAVADTVARETGAQTAVLDPLEGLTAESAGNDYLAVMRSNLAALRDGLGCR